MKYLIPLLFLLATPLWLGSQTLGTAAATRYVWAESGLVLRAAGAPAAERIGVVPFGSAVQLTGERGQQHRVVAMRSVSYEWDGVQTSEPYVMKEHYVEVLYGEQRGYVYAGYLSRFSPENNRPPAERVYGWLETMVGKPDTLIKAPTSADAGPWKQRVRYANGITISAEEIEGGGSLTLKIPGGTINEGYLIAAKYFGLRASVDNEEFFKEVGDLLPALLSVTKDGSLELRGSHDVYNIFIEEGNLVIFTASGC
ncbi:MAG: hypothetical protein AAF840_11745 [Bacteroidota bacterium]